MKYTEFFGIQIRLRNFRNLKRDNLFEPDRALCRLRLEHNFELYHLVTTNEVFPKLSELAVPNYSVLPKEKIFTLPKTSNDHQGLPNLGKSIYQLLHFRVELDNCGLIAFSGFSE